MCQTQLLFSQSKQASWVLTFFIQRYIQAVSVNQKHTGFDCSHSTHNKWSPEEHFRLYTVMKVTKPMQGENEI